MEYNWNEFDLTMSEWNIEISHLQKSQLLRYYEMLIERNKVMNLTTITEFDEVVMKHFLDSISICKIIDLNQEFHILDLGTGAGFPGIPLKICFPNLKIVLADSLNKRVLFLQDVISELNLVGIKALHARAEELARDKEYRENFDYCVSRAVANLSTLSEYCLPFVKEAGKFISYKANDIDQETNEAKHAIFLLGGKLEKIEKFDLPNSELHRSFVVINKVKKTPKIYPRKAGLPAKQPLQ